VLDFLELLFIGSLACEWRCFSLLFQENGKVGKVVAFTAAAFDVS